MKKLLSCCVLAGGALFAAADHSAAATIDFTLDGTLSGNVDGAIYSVSAVGGSLNQMQRFDGARPVTEPLALQNDGIGIGDDEIDFGQTLMMDFDRLVRVTRVFFLDLFEAPDGTSHEAPIVASDASGNVDVDLSTLQKFGDMAPGWTTGTFGSPFVGRTFSFTAAASNDGMGSPDYALAGIEFEVVPAPLPAAAVLFGTALMGLGALARAAQAERPKW